MKRVAQIFGADQLAVGSVNSRCIIGLIGEGVMKERMNLGSVFNETVRTFGIEL